MAKATYNPELCRELERAEADLPLEIKHRPIRYEAGTVLTYGITGVTPAISGQAELTVDKFLGGGFAGQVYRCRCTALDLPGGQAIDGLDVGKLYAVKIVIPPSGFSRRFRNTIYWLAFQGPFSSQVNAGACRAGLLWQKLVRRAGRTVWGRETAVKDAYASFWDSRLNAYGEITEWIEGRMWHLEADAHIGRRRDWQHVDLAHTDSAEYVAKRRFMAEMVGLMHDLGAPEFARQYEWWTLKSQPNAMKRTDLPDTDGPADGLCAIDFRAGLALLPWLPMSPGDVKLILDGLFKRRTLVQFDRCDLAVMDRFVAQHPDVFAGMEPAIAELREADRAYRDSLPDITHHRLRLLTDPALRRSVRQGLVEGYMADDLADEAFAAKLRTGGPRFALFYLLGALPGLGRLIRKRWGNAAYRRHVTKIITRPSYFKTALKARAAHDLVAWHRKGRTDESRTRYLLARPGLFLVERCTVGLLPAGLHRVLTQPIVVWQAITGFCRFLRSFLVSADFRERWFLDQIEEGHREGMLTDQERDEIVSVVRDPFIVKYLKCMAVHFATLPVTQIVSVAVGGVAAGYVISRGGTKMQAAATFAGILALFQITPISPGSICRGSFVVYLMIRERNWRDYLIAAPLSFAKYIGYLAFPLQMTTTYPHLARFMASRWATNAVHIVPIFGEKGALFEHWVFDLFFNVPQMIGRHKRGLLSLWMAIGTAAATALLWLRPVTIKGWTTTMIVLVVVFILPRVLFYPLLTRAGRGTPTDHGT